MSAVTIYEVGPRDGLQNEPIIVPTRAKLELIRRLIAAGAEVVEATSFVRSDLVPQLADAGELLSSLEFDGSVRFPVLVPNSRGLDRAIDAGVNDVAIFAAASDEFSRRNLGRDVAASLKMFRPVVDGARAVGTWVRAYVSTAWGCPFQGTVDREKVAELAATFHDWGCDEICLGDTIGVAAPAEVAQLIDRVAEVMPLEALAVHLHDTYGQGLANALTAMERGVSTVDSAVGGLGGCPFAGEGATGNLATEDLVYALDRQGVATGLDLDQLVATSWWLTQHTGHEPVSRVAKALRSR